jgi:hypothetical protein
MSTYEMLVGTTRLEINLVWLSFLIFPPLASSSLILPAQICKRG